jgi:hypothetical protein
MAIVSNTFLTYSAIGNREDLRDAIYNISPTDTPFMNSIGKGKATSRLHEWQTDSLRAAADNAQLEGDDITFGAVTATVRLSNRTQISREEIIVSGTQDVVSKAGRAKEMTYQMAKAAKELKRDMEHVLLDTQTPTTGDSTTAQLMRALPEWIVTNDTPASATGLRGASGVQGSSSAAVTDGTQRALTEDMLKTALKLAWDEGGEPNIVMVGSFNKQVISGFTGNATRFDKSEDKKLVNAVDVYSHDFGEVKIVPNRFQRARDCWVLDTSMWEVAYLRPMFTKDLAATGDATKGAHIVEYTLVSKNEAASACVVDLTTS